MSDKEFLGILREIEFTPESAWNSQDAWRPKLSPEVTEALHEIEQRWGKYKWEDPEYQVCRKEYNDLRNSEIAKELAALDFGRIIEVERDGGGEGEGEHVQYTVYFEKFNKYVQATASYYSYHGVDYWSEWEIVRPYEETITVYR